MQHAIRVAALFCLLAFATIFPASAQLLDPVTPLINGTPGFTVGNPGNITGAITATLSGFAPAGTFASLTSAGTSGSVALPAGTVVAIQNTGTTTVSCTLGVGSATALASELQVPASSTVFVTVGSNTFGACIDQTGSTSNTVVLAGGTGLGTGFGGGGGGGGGGAVTLASGAVASGAYSAGAYAAGAVVAGAFVDGSDLTQGTKADAAWTSGSGSVIALLKAAATSAATTATNTGAAIPAGTAIIGKVGIDQTTPGTTNAVSATNFPSAVATGTGAQGATSPRMTVAVDSATVAGSAPGTKGAPSTQYLSTQGGYFYNVASSVLTRIANTTAYAANETVCLFTSTTVCAPITISIAGANAGQGILNRISLLKSGATTTNASFTIWLFSAAPGTATPNQFDATAYAGPRAADMPNYIGNASCTSPVVTSDTTAQVWYDCTLSNPNSAGAIVFQALSGATTIDALISVTAAYTPASGETFKVFASGIY